MYQPLNLCKWIPLPDSVFILCLEHSKLIRDVEEWRTLILVLIIWPMISLLNSIVLMSWFWKTSKKHLKCSFHINPRNSPELFDVTLDKCCILKDGKECANMLTPAWNSDWGYQRLNLNRTDLHCYSRNTLQGFYIGWGAIQPVHQKDPDISGYWSTS